MSKELTTYEAADLTGMHPESLRRAARDGRLKARKDGRAWRIERTELMDYLKGDQEWQIFSRLHVKLNARLSKVSTVAMSS